MNEIWKDIKGYEGHYQISDLGRVKSLKHNKERILIQLKSHTKINYLFVILSFNDNKKRAKIHQLVAVHFLGHKINGHVTVVDHIDNNTLNNRLDNLQLITQRANSSKKKRGKSKFTGVSWHKPYKKWKAQIWYDNKNQFLGYFDNELEASEVYQDKLKQL